MSSNSHARIKDFLPGGGGGGGPGPTARKQLWQRFFFSHQLLFSKVSFPGGVQHFPGWRGSGYFFQGGGGP